MSKSRLIKSPRELKLEELRWEEKRYELKRGLPHLYGTRLYTWQKLFINSRNKVNLLTAANQIGKTTCQIKKNIHWATEKSLWPELWPKSEPRQFWYLYPSLAVANVEFNEKWIPDLLPSGNYKDEGKYGWKPVFDKGSISAIDFNSGVSIYFKTYAQNLQNLQSGSVHMVSNDEELPEDLFSELQFRLNGATIQGYFNMVFTATLNQDFWRRAMEPRDTETEILPDAFKQQISIYDCLVYDDGTPGPWTEEMIEETKRRCKNEQEVQRRVYGKFVSEGGRKYHAYIADTMCIDEGKLSANQKRGPDWKVYCGIDHGSGGKKNHPAAIVFVAVNSEHTFGVVFRAWRGDNIETTAGDTIDKWVEMKRDLIITRTFYDWSAKDLHTIAERQGEGLEAANKSHELGEDTLNTLFKSGALIIVNDDLGQTAKLSGELTTLMQATAKMAASDDLVDATRYACVSIPWNWEVIFKRSGQVGVEFTPIQRPLTEAERQADEIRERRGECAPREKGEWDEIEDEIREWNDLYG